MNNELPIIKGILLGMFISAIITSSWWSIPVFGLHKWNVIPAVMLTLLLVAVFIVWIFED